MKDHGVQRILLAVARSRGIRFATLVLAAMSPATAFAQSVAPQAATAGTTVDGAKDPKICRSQGKSGSHLMKKRCLLKSQWVELDRKAYFKMEERRFQQGFQQNQ
jgi:hypothetical protein